MSTEKLTDDELSDRYVAQHACQCPVCQKYDIEVDAGDGYCHACDAEWTETWEPACTGITDIKEGE